LEKYKSDFELLPNKKIIVRAEDVPLFVEQLTENGINCVGLTGEDLFLEYQQKNKNLENLKNVKSIENQKNQSGVKAKLRIIQKISWVDENALFGKPALCLMGKQKALNQNSRVGINKKYSALAEEYFCKKFLEKNLLEKNSLKQNNSEESFPKTKLYFNGATEEAALVGLVDFVVDIVYSGNSAKEAGLEIIEKILESDVVLIGGEKMTEKENEVEVCASKIVSSSNIVSSEFAIENENLLNEVNFQKMNNLIPTIIQEEDGKIISLVYSNKESLEKSIQTKKVWRFSREQKKVMMKGATSGNEQEIISIKTDCDNDALLFKVKQKGIGCHKGNYTCFNEEKEFSLKALYNKILERKNNPQIGSYTKKLFDDELLLKRKLVEESAEVITAKDKENLIWECSDLIYFLFVIMAKNEITIEDIEKENKKRDK
jgi:phosphoribosyl-ATP pyrophosphohydrolase/phosphoribosyl-AMP cyclohydrolase